MKQPTDKQKEWLWFAGLWLSGFLCMTAVSLIIKGLMALI